MGNYKPQWVAGYFDNLGIGEWRRLKQSPLEEVKLHLHTHFLHEFVKRGDYVLEVGAGAGRFTQVLAALGARIVVADISAGQLKLNRRHAAKYRFGRRVEDWLQLDVCNMRALKSRQFDRVVCYGGPLSYVFEKRVAAVREVRRVLKPSGIALFSVMSLWGSLHAFLAQAQEVPVRENAVIIRSGDLAPATYKAAKHFCHLFRAAEFRELMERNGWRVLKLAASNCVATAWGHHLARIRKNRVRWRELLEMEIEACQEPGCVDLGTHLIGVARKA